jgi:Domain of unknown function (DUF6438)
LHGAYIFDSSNKQTLLLTILKTKKMKNALNLLKFRNGMLMNLSIAIGIALLSSCAKDEAPSISSNGAGGSGSALARAPKGDETLFMIRKHEGLEDDVAYEIRVTADGEVLFNGISGVRFIGTYEFKVDEMIVWDIAQSMSDRGFLDMRDEYPAQDLNGARATILNLDTRTTKTVIDYNVDIPDALDDMERQIIERLDLGEFVELK